MENVLAYHQGNRSFSLRAVPNTDNTGLHSANRQVLEPGVVFPVLRRGHAKIAAVSHPRHRRHHSACLSTFGRRDRLQSLITQIVLQEANTRIKPHTFITNFPNLLLYVQNVDHHTHDWRGVFLLQNEPGGASRLLTAERGQFRIESGQSLALEAQLFNGVSLEYQVQSASSSSQSAALFAKSIVRLVDNPKTADDEGKDSGSGKLILMSLQEISEFAAEAKTDRERRQADRKSTRLN